ncbi:Trp biosynthesis-associated membrane protein [Microbacterium fluvii]|uniref:Trp biosynthesis-associated membrane protein n=1 Tax=Microbacterium fluvii TaxID=415215 RepID=A0ABW2HG52_9MICO|nr:Trp biosynthesis-associated membrane protein [Microbacterium fluvii]MCU4672053.1 Trp biosynthesis-associated membrane protein [Microbacterium fluvii]
MRARARLLSVLVMLATGAVGVISSTQTWLTVVLDDGAQHELAVSGAAALPVLAPLSLAVLALGGALSIVGRVLRYVFGALAVVIGVVLFALTWPIAIAHPVTAVASVVTEATGIAGIQAIADLVADIAATPWPVVSLVAWCVLIAAGVFTLATAHTWAATGRRYDTAADHSAAAPTAAAGSRPHDAIDDWDDLSRGDDPTT